MSAPQRFRKMPVEIEAQRYTDAESGSEIIKRILDAGGSASLHCVDPDQPDHGGHTIRIRTLEGDMHAALGDWVICGVQGEFYPCKPDIFEQTYAEVREATAEDLQRSERRSLFAPRVHALADTILHSPRVSDPGRVQYRPAAGGLVLAELTIAAALTDDELPTSACAPVRTSAPMVSVQTYADTDSVLTPAGEFRYGPGTVAIKIEHEGGNTVRGPIDVVLSTHLADGWRLASVDVEPDTKPLTATAAVQVRVIPEGEPYDGPVIGTVAIVAPPEHVDEARRVISTALRGNVGYSE